MTLENESIGITYADPAMWTQKNLEGIISSSADEYMRNGIPLMKADNKRIAGKRKIDGLLASSPDGMPGIMIFSNCVNLIEQLENIPVDPNNPEDVDTDADDHAIDSLKYSLSNVNIGSYTKPGSEKKRHPALDVRLF